MKHPNAIAILLCAIPIHAAGADLGTAANIGGASWLLWALGCGLLAAGMYFGAPRIVTVLVAPLSFILVLMSQTGMLGATMAVIVVLTTALLIPKLKKPAAKSPTEVDKVQ